MELEKMNAVVLNIAKMISIIGDKKMAALCVLVPDLPDILQKLNTDLVNFIGENYDMITNLIENFDQKMISDLHHLVSSSRF